MIYILYMDKRQYTLTEVIDKQRAAKLGKEKVYLGPQSSISCGSCNYPMKRMGVTTSKSSIDDVKRHTHQFSCKRSNCDKPEAAKVDVEQELIVGEDEKGFETETVGDIIDITVKYHRNHNPTVVSEYDFTMES
jgi:hypothetical protein